MKLTAKKMTFLAAATLTLCFQTISFAQTTPSTAVTPQEKIQTDAIEIVKPPAKTARKASWQGKKVALKGRDVVSFFENEKPLKGSKQYVVDWDDTKWRFSSEKNRDLFIQDPKKYIPEFGGFCPVALADNNAKIGKSTHYSVINDKLYLNYNRTSKSAFNENPDNFLVRAQLNF